MVSNLLSHIRLKKLVIGISGSSGSIYAARLLDRLAGYRDQWASIGIVMSSNAHANWNIEIGSTFSAPEGMVCFEKNDFNAPFASGSARYDTMIVCPCSMGTMARIATGISNDLMTRAADVILKERRRLILVPRETPLSLIHLRHMVTITECGGLILPAIPSFYNNPSNMLAIVDTVVDRVLDQAGFQIHSKRWNTPDE
jgi:flavin prenyltransferase